MSITLYPGIAFSPQAELTDNIGAADTIIPVSDAAAFPEAPNLATIGTDEEGETILYTAKTANALSGCRRGVEGTAKSWQAGEPIGRNFTAKDHADLIAEVREAAEAAVAAGQAERGELHGKQQSSRAFPRGNADRGLALVRRTSRRKAGQAGLGLSGLGPPRESRVRGGRFQ